MSQKRRTPEDEPFLVVRSSAASLPTGFEIRSHAHPWHQLIFATSGVMTVETAAGHWVVPARSALWAPAGCTHSIRCTGTTALRTLYLRPGWAGSVPLSSTAMRVSGLLRELISRVVDRGALDSRSEPDRALALLVLEELRSLDAPPLDLPTPTSDELRALTLRLQVDAAIRLTTAGLARQIGLGTRTLERRFLAETGMTFYRWRRQARMLRALEELALGAPLKSVAAGTGYRSASAFVAAFRATFGSSPGRYVARLRAAGQTREP